MFILISTKFVMIRNRIQPTAHTDCHSAALLFFADLKAFFKIDNLGLGDKNFRCRISKRDKLFLPKTKLQLLNDHLVSI